MSNLREQVANAYHRLTRDELVLFCSLRSLPATGDLVSILTTYDLARYHLPLPTQPPKEIQSSRSLFENQAPLNRRLDLPVDIIAEILDHVGDWELSTSVSVPTSLQPPNEWLRATPLDKAILSGRLPLVRPFKNSKTTFTKVGACVAIRFGFIHVIEHLRTYHRASFNEHFGENGTWFALKASEYNQPAMLSWWRQCPDFTKLCDPDVVDLASKSGSVNALEWWRSSSNLPMQYTEAALEGASLKGHIPVLEWWRDSGLTLKIGKVMESASLSGQVAVLEWWSHKGPEQPKYEKQALYLASCHERVSVLQWWLQSGLQLIFDADVLVGATRMNRAKVLDWWDQSGLTVPYRLCDIEEALEDAIGGGEGVRTWWRRKGVDFHAGDAEWMKTRYLN
jgi:hypothetical protein